jgi:hypothetical protein
MSDDNRYSNPYLAAMILTSARERLEAVSQFLEKETHRLHRRLHEIENDDGSIPEEGEDEWSMTKGKLDQTRIFHGLIVPGILAEERKREDDDAGDDPRDDFGGDAILHVEVDGEPVDFGHSDTPARGNIGISPTTVPVEFEVGSQTVTIDCEMFVDD